jgi:hypothetical protein
MNLGIERGINDALGTLTSPANLIYGGGARGGTFIEDRGAYDFTTRNAAPPGSVVDPLDTRLGLKQWARQYRYVENNQTVWSFGALCFQPNAANISTWYGAKFYIRQYQAGQNPTPVVWTTRKKTENTSMYPAGEIFYAPDNIKIPDDQLCEIVIVPQVLSGGSIQDSRYAIYGLGKFYGDSSSRTWSTNEFKTETMETWRALGQINTTVPTPSNAVVQVSDFKAVIPYNYRSGVSVPTGTNAVDYAYFQLTFDHRAITNTNPNDYKGIRVYTQSWSNGSVETNGPWEYRDFIQSNTGGSITVKWRWPISNSYWSDYLLNIKAPPYSTKAYFGEIGTSQIANIRTAIRVIRQNNSLSDTVLYHITPSSGYYQLPPTSTYTYNIPVNTLQSKIYTDFDQYTDINYYNQIQRLSRLRLSNAIAAVADVGTVAATNQFVDPTTGARNYVKRWT